MLSCNHRHQKKTKPGKTSSEVVVSTPDTDSNPIKVNARVEVKVEVTIPEAPTEFEIVDIASEVDPVDPVDPVEPAHPLNAHVPGGGATVTTVPAAYVMPPQPPGNGIVLVPAFVTNRGSKYHSKPTCHQIKNNSKTQQIQVPQDQTVNGLTLLYDRMSRKTSLVVVGLMGVGG